MGHKKEPIYFKLSKTISQEATSPLHTFRHTGKYIQLKTQDWTIRLH